MPWFKVTAKRQFIETYEVEAEDEDEALSGTAPIFNHEGWPVVDSELLEAHAELIPDPGEREMIEGST